MRPLVECVPNISEGRDIDVINTIVQEARRIPGCSIISVEPDADYNRTVITIAGEPESVSMAAFSIISASLEHIDMRQHSGEHPRIGAVDVCPFIPLRDYTYSQANQLAHDLGKQVFEDLSIPVFFYGDAAVDDSRRILSNLRKGEYEGLENRFSNTCDKHDENTRLPDLCSPSWTDVSAKFGAVVIGTRPILVAYNVNLNEEDAKVAKICGTIIRTSGRLIKSGEKRMRVSGML